MHKNTKDATCLMILQQGDITINKMYPEQQGVPCYLFRVKKTCRVIQTLQATPNLKYHSKVIYAIEIQGHCVCCVYFHACRKLTTVVFNCSFDVNSKEAVILTWLYMHIAISRKECFKVDYKELQATNDCWDKKNWLFPRISSLKTVQ